MISRSQSQSTVLLAASWVLIVAGFLYYTNTISSLESEIAELKQNKRTATAVTGCASQIEKLSEAIQTKQQQLLASHEKVNNDVLNGYFGKLSEVVQSLKDDGASNHKAVLNAIGQSMIRSNSNGGGNQQQQQQPSLSSESSSCVLERPEAPHVRPIACMQRMVSLPPVVIVQRKDCTDPVMLKELNTLKDVVVILNHIGFKGNGVVLGARGGGKTVVEVMKAWSGEKVTIVDPLTGGNADTLAALHKTFSDVSHKYELLRHGYLYASEMKDSSIDFVLFDSQAMTYKALMGQLEAWYPKVKSTGILFGMDYVLRAFDESGGVVSVKDAVDHFAAVKGMRVQTTRDATADSALSVTGGPSWYMQKLCD